MIDQTFKELQKLRKNWNKKIQIVDIINGKLYDFQSIFPDEKTAKKVITKDIHELINATYDYFPGYVSLTKGMIICVVYHFQKKELIGTIALYHYNMKSVVYIELGLSLIAPKYRKMGFQSVEINRIREYAYYFLSKGFPFYASARMEFASTQLLIHRSKFKDTNNKLVPPMQPKGFLPQYIANKDEKGNFILEFGLFYDAWTNLDKIIQKEVILPKDPKIKEFQILNPNFRKDLIPKYVSVEIIDKNNILIMEKKYVWDKIKGDIKIF